MVTFGSTSETSTSLRRYTRDLYSRLEDETGLATGFAPVGFIELATNPDRLEEFRRVAAFNRHLGVEVEEISPTEVAEAFPLARVDDVIAGFHVAGDGRVNPADVTMSLSAGARKLGVKIVEGVRVTGIRSDRGAVTGVETGQGTVECEFGVNGAGVRVRRQLRRNVGPSARRRPRGVHPAPGSRALLPDHRADPRCVAHLAGDRGSLLLRLLPRGDRRFDDRPVRAGGRAVENRGRARRV